MVSNRPSCFRTHFITRTLDAQVFYKMRLHILYKTYAHLSCWIACSTEYSVNANVNDCYTVLCGK